MAAETSEMGFKESNFREYLANSGAATELARVLVGLEEASARPGDPVGFIRDHFDKDLPDIVKQERLDIEAMLAENAELKARDAELSTKLAEAAAAIAEREVVAFAPPLDELLALHADGGDVERLDLAKLYAAVSARFPAEVEDAPWAAEGFEPPAGSFHRLLCDEWARRVFGWGTEMQEAHPGLTLQAMITLSEGGEPMEPAMAEGAFAACVLLPTVEPPPEQ